MANISINSSRQYLDNNGNLEAKKQKASTKHDSIIDRVTDDVKRKAEQKYSDFFRKETNKMEEISKKEAQKSNKNFMIDNDGQPWLIINEGETLGDIVKRQSNSISDKECYNRIAEILKLNGLSLLHKIKSGVKLKVPNSVLPDVTNDLNDMMRKHAKDPGIKDLEYFKEKVKTNGEWDLKTKPGYRAEDYKYFIYDGEIYNFDAIGNIHYGYVGQAAPWSTEHALYLGAGIYQNYSDLKSRKNILIKDQTFPIYGDNLDDFYSVKKGIDSFYRDYYKNLFPDVQTLREQKAKLDDFIKRREYKPLEERNRKRKLYDIMNEGYDDQNKSE